MAQPKQNPTKIIKSVISGIFIFAGLGLVSEIVAPAAPYVANQLKSDLGYVLMIFGIGIFLSRRPTVSTLILFFLVSSYAFLFGNDQFNAMIFRNKVKFTYVSLVAIGGSLAFELIVNFNRLKRQEEAIAASLGNIQSLYIKRLDMIPAIAGQVEKFLDHERSVFVEVSAARSGMALPAGTAADSKSLLAFQKADQALLQFKVASEAYPELKSASQSEGIMATVLEIEAEILNSRNAFNASVLEFNRELKMFPMVLISKYLGLVPSAYFDAQLKSDSGQTAYASMRAPQSSATLK